MQSSAADPKSSAAAAASGRHDARMVCAIGAGDPTQASRAGATKVIPSKFAIIGPSSRAGARPCCFSRSTSSGCSAPVTAYAAIHAWDVRMMQLAALCRGPLRHDECRHSARFFVLLRRQRLESSLSHAAAEQPTSPLWRMHFALRRQSALAHGH